MNNKNTYKTCSTLQSFSMASLNALRGKPQKFAGFLKEDYKGTFSNCENMFVSRLCNFVKKDSDKDYEMTVTEKMDGVALLLSFTYKQVTQDTFENMQRQGNLVNFEQEHCDRLSFKNKYERQLFFCTMLHMWAEPWKYFSGRIIGSKYFVFLVQLWAPTHNFKPLLVPHILRQSIEDKLCNVLRQHPAIKDLPFDTTQLLLYRCEFVVGSYGPTAAASMIARWKTVAQNKREIFDHKDAKFYRISRRAYDFVKHVTHAQWDNSVLFDKNANLCILDEIGFDKIDQNNLKYFNFDRNTSNVPVPSFAYSDTKDDFQTRHSNLSKLFGKVDRSTYAMVNVVRRNEKLEKAIKNQKIDEAEKLVQQYEVNNDNEGFMVCFENTNKDSPLYQNLVFCKLKNFQIVTLSCFESKLGFNWKRQPEDQTGLENMGLLYFFAGYHFLQTEHFSMVERMDNEDKVHLPLCLKLTRWGNVKDLSSAQNTVDSTRFCDKEDWNQSKFCVIWSHYIKDARIRLNHVPISPQSIPRGGRIWQYLKHLEETNRERIEPFRTLQHIQASPTTDNDKTALEEYNKAVFRDICWSMLLFVYVHKNKNSIDNLWPDLGLIARQMYKNLIMMDSFDCYDDGSLITSLLFQCDELPILNRHFDKTKLKSEWAKAMVENDRLWQANPGNLHNLEWQTPGMLMRMTNLVEDRKQDFGKREGQKLAKYLQNNFDAADETLQSFSEYIATKEKWSRQGEDALMNYLQNSIYKKNMLSPNNINESEIKQRKGALLKFFFKSTLKLLRPEASQTQTAYWYRDNFYDAKTTNNVKGKIPNYFDHRLTPLAACFENLFDKNGKPQNNDIKALVEATLKNLQVQKPELDVVLEIVVNIQEYWNEHFDNEKELWQKLKSKMQDEMTAECRSMLFNQYPHLSSKKEEFMQMRLHTTPECKRKQDFCDKSLQYFKQNDLMYAWSVIYNSVVFQIFTGFKTRFDSLFNALNRVAQEQTFSFDDATMQSKAETFLKQFNQNFFQIFKDMGEIVVEKKTKLWHFEHAASHFEKYKYKHPFLVKKLTAIDGPPHNSATKNFDISVKNLKIRYNDLWVTAISLVADVENESLRTDTLQTIASVKNVAWSVLSVLDVLILDPSFRTNIKECEVDSFLAAKMNFKLNGHNFEHIMLRFQSHNHLNLKFGALQVKD